MSICVKFSTGASGSAGGRAMYDTKERATMGEKERVWTRNVPDYVDKRDPEISYKELRANLAEYARQMDEDELERSHEGKGETRSYYRAIYSFHENTSDEKAIEMVNEHQGENFEKCSIINSLHRNAGHVHVHSIIFARQIDGKKLQLGWKSYREIDESWARIYGREFGEHLAREHLEKKEERRAHRVSAREAKLNGEKPPPRPRRVTHERNQVEERKQISLREYGAIPHDQTRVGRDQRSVAVADRRAERAVAQQQQRERGFGIGGRTQSSRGRERALTRETSGIGDGAREAARVVEDLRAAPDERILADAGSPPKRRRLKADRTQQAEPEGRGVSPGARAGAGQTQGERQRDIGGARRDIESQYESRELGETVPTSLQGQAEGREGARQGISGIEHGQIGEGATGMLPPADFTRATENAGRTATPLLIRDFGLGEPTSGLPPRGNHSIGVDSVHSLANLEPVCRIDSAIADAVRPLSEQKEKELAESISPTSISVQSVPELTREPEIVHEVEKVVDFVMEL